jgi:hypothetical protein
VFQAAFIGAWGSSNDIRFRITRLQINLIALYFIRKKEEITSVVGLDLFLLVKI